MNIKRKLKSNLTQLVYDFGENTFFNGLIYQIQNSDSDCFVNHDLREDVIKKLIEENKLLKARLSKFELNRDHHSDSQNENGHL